MRLIDKKGSNIIPYEDSIAWISGENNYCFLKGNEMVSLTEHEYMKATVGENWKKIDRTLKSNGLGTSWSLGDNGELFSIHYQNGLLNYWSNKGELKEVVDLNVLFNYGHSIYDIEFQTPHFLWLTFPSGQTIIQFDLESKKEIFRIGEFTFEEKYDPFSYPEMLFSEEESLYIPCMGSGDIFELNFESKALSLYKTTDKPLWEFVKVPEEEFVRIDNSIFKLEE